MNEASALVATGYRRGSIKDLPSAEIQVKGPDGNPTGMVVELAGPEHPKRKQIEFAQQRKIRSQLQKTGKLELADPADDEQDGIEKLAGCTLGWKLYLDEAGKEIPFSTAEAQSSYALEPWLRNQLLTALNERERFIKSSAKA